MATPCAAEERSSPPPVGSGPDPPLKPSFASVVFGQAASSAERFEELSLHVHKPIVLDGVSCTSFSTEEVSGLGSDFSSTVVVRSWGPKPSFQAIRHFLTSRLKVTSPLLIISLDLRHRLIRCSTYLDFCKVFAVDSVVLERVRIQFVKWSPAFRTDSRVSCVSVWVRFPGLNLHLFHPNALLSLAYQIGNRIFVDPRTVHGFCPGYRCVCVEIDMLSIRPDFVYILNGDIKIKQQIVYERLPLFCSRCCLFGLFLLCCSAHSLFENPPAEGVSDSNASDVPFQDARSHSSGDGSPSDADVVPLLPAEGLSIFSSPFYSSAG